MFFLPLFDDNPTKGTPKVTYSLILINILVFIYQLTLNPDQEYRLFLDYGFIPKEFFESTYIGYFELISSLFLHGGFMHLFSNMLFLYIFGDNIECILGPIKFTIFYLICGFIASIFQGIIDPSSTVPMIGASGSIAGVLGAYFLIYPRANVRVYLENPAGIGEHPDVVQAIDTQIAVIAENQEKLEILNSRRFNFTGDKYPVE